PRGRDPARGAERTGTCEAPFSFTAHQGAVEVVDADHEIAPRHVLSGKVREVGSELRSAAAARFDSRRARIERQRGARGAGPRREPPDELDLIACDRPSEERCSPAGLDELQRDGLAAERSREPGHDASLRNELGARVVERDAKLVATPVDFTRDCEHSGSEVTGILERSAFEL